MQFKKAAKSQSKLRLALCGPAGSGKTYTALTLACGLGQRVAVIDTERGSASKYADEFAFDVLELDYFAPAEYVKAIRLAEKAGYDVCIIDSLSHAWNADGGVLEIVDHAAEKARGNKFAGWREGTPAHNDLVNAITQSRMHVVVTMRSKTEYVQDVDDHGKKTVRKVGMAPIQRDGVEYEFDIVGDMDWSNNLTITKTRCKVLAGKVIRKPDAELAATIKSWLEDGATAPETRTNTPPRDTAEAEQRFFARYADTVGGETWADVQRYLMTRTPKPTKIEGWIAAAEAIRDRTRQEAVTTPVAANGHNQIPVSDLTRELLDDPDLP